MRQIKPLLKGGGFFVVYAAFKSAAHVGARARQSTRVEEQCKPPQRARDRGKRGGDVAKKKAPGRTL